ncbi:hypothetical protein MSAN_00359800 [Mycena sanguinolenta]|uniref:Uncharacterized protein n=1 Tax=Mycena sanguinolenta TaxID=230812 RepID=A0A8H7DJM3_9AGAR|nr:hypothetical protein MSAN_00359800 [Mycena sanguinolenta]
MASPFRTPTKLHCSAQPYPPFPYASSPLPPSDPFPSSTASTRYQGEHEYGGESVPPITTLAAASADHASSPPREERPKPKSLKVTLKLPKPPSSDDVDELDAFEGEGSGEGADAMMPPLPIFGASSTAAETASAPPAKAPKKSRKKHGADEGEKPPKKPRAKKAKTDENGQEKPKKKGKGKEKEKEAVYKSAEFIPDDADDDEPADGVPLPPMDVDVPVAGPSTSKPVSVMSIPDSQADEELTPLIDEKRDMADKGDGGAVDGNAANKGKVKGTEKKSKKAKTATVTVDKAKKRPAKKAKGKTVVSDEEDGAADANAMMVDSTTPPPDMIPSLQDVLESVGEDDAKMEKVKVVKIRKIKKTVMTDSEGEEDVRPAKKAKTKVVQSDSEGDDQFQNKPNENSPPRTSSQSQVENDVNINVPQKKHLEETPKPSISSKYTVAPRTKSTDLAEAIRRVNANLGSPSSAVVPRRSSLSGVVSAASNSGTPTTSYSPHHKFSRRALSRIAPLHPNRRTPPPPLPPPPPKPKTKKEKEREERWEEEMIEAVGGWDEWKLLSEQEQKAARRAKWARELEGYED